MPYGPFISYIDAMRLFYMTSQHIGEVILREKRLKQSRISEMNDPFELLGASIGERDARWVFKILHAHWTRSYGVICFSDNWKSPVMWAHYAEKHHGLCFGFDVPNELASEVRYEPARLNIIDRKKRLMGVDQEAVNTLLVTKFKEWSYEHEWRVFGSLQDRDPVTKHHYIDFGPTLQLRDVVIGARCRLSIAAVAKLVGKIENPVTVRKARASFTRFEIIQRRDVTPITVKPRR